MARRNDHSRDELKSLAIASGQQIIKSEGFVNFSARKVAKNIGYTIGTIYNIFTSHHDFILHINLVTLQDISKYISLKTTRKGEEALKQMVSAYIKFAHNDYNRWIALFEHIIPKGKPIPNWYQIEVNKIFSLVESHFKNVINDEKTAKTAAITLWAGIHGICQLGLTGKLELTGNESVESLADSFIYNYIRGLKI
jgi:AcrR family transcriptional regulator